MPLLRPHDVSRLTFHAGLSVVSSPVSRPTSHDIPGMKTSPRSPTRGAAAAIPPPPPAVVRAANSTTWRRGSRTSANSSATTDTCFCRGGVVSYLGSYPPRRSLVFLPLSFSCPLCLTCWHTCVAESSCTKVFRVSMTHPAVSVSETPASPARFVVTCFLFCTSRWVRKRTTAEDIDCWG